LIFVIINIKILAPKTKQGFILWRPNESPACRKFFSPQNHRIDWCFFLHTNVFFPRIYLCSTHGRGKIFLDAAAHTFRILYPTTALFFISKSAFFCITYRWPEKCREICSSCAFFHEKSTTYMFIYICIRDGGKYVFFGSQDFFPRNELVENPVVIDIIYDIFPSCVYFSFFACRQLFSSTNVYSSPT